MSYIQVVEDEPAFVPKQPSEKSLKKKASMKIDDEKRERDSDKKDDKPEDKKKGDDASGDDEKDDEEEEGCTVNSILASSTCKVFIALAVYIAVFFAGAMLAFYIYRSVKSGELNKCRSAPRYENPILDNAEPIVQSQQTELKLRNVKILDPTFATSGEHDITIQNGKITAITQAIDKRKRTKSQTANEIDGDGRYVTAGLIDLHSHLGVDATPGLRAQLDVNEATRPASK